MKHRHHLIATAVVAFTVTIGAGVATTPAFQQDPPAGMEGMPPMPPPPGEQHAWLQQLVGTWTFESEMAAPGMPPMTSTGTDVVRSLGGRWVIGELTNEIPGMGTMNAMLTLGYDTAHGRYQGTWVDSMTDHLWVYEGTLDPTGKIMTLEAEGPNMMDPAGGTALYRDVIEFRSADHRTLSSYARVDGKWVQFMTATYRRTR